MEHIVKLFKARLKKRHHNVDEPEQFRQPCGFIVVENRACSAAIVTDMTHNSYGCVAGVNVFNYDEQGGKKVFLSYNTLDALLDDYTGNKREAV